MIKILPNRDEEPANGIFTLKLVTKNAETGDTVSFSNAVIRPETTALKDQNITIFYTVADRTLTNELEMSFGKDTQKVFLFGPGSFFHVYTLNPKDAVKGVITITAEFFHTSLIRLDPPADVTFDQTGAIGFTPGANNADAGGCTYAYTLFKDDAEVAGFIDEPIINGETVAALAGEMLKANGVYTVQVTAYTQNGAYTPKSNPASSAATSAGSSGAVNVYALDVEIITDDPALNEKILVTVGESIKEYTQTVYVFKDTTVELKAALSGSRVITWGADGSGMDNSYLVRITKDTRVTATFGNPYIVITRQPEKDTLAVKGTVQSLTVAAELIGLSGGLKYQWYSRDDSTSPPTDTPLNAQTAPVFQIPLGLTKGFYYYFCIVSADGADPAKSELATVVVDLPQLAIGTPTAPAYMSNYKNRNALTPISPENMATFTVTVSGFDNDTDANNVALVIPPVDGLMV